jgi:hypothetical protein
MKNPIVFAVALALALAATPTLAQDNTGNSQPQPATGDQQSGSDAQQPRHHPHRHAANPPASYGHDQADMALTGNEPGTAAYQNSDDVKPYPAVDHGHVPGDPAVINHKDDQATVGNPTKTTITVPPR